MPGMIDPAEVQAMREALFDREMGCLRVKVKELLEYVRHIDTKLDILQGDIDELAIAFRLNERLAEVERSLAESWPPPPKVGNHKSISLE